MVFLEKILDWTDDHVPDWVVYTVGGFCRLYQQICLLVIYIWFCYFIVKMASINSIWPFHPPAP